jgi:hypothetical protein
MTNHKYPIQDIQFHEEGLREAASHSLSRDEAIAVSWHTTAIAYLQFGSFKGINGPAAEREVNGRMVPAPIEDYLIPATDNHGMTYFKHVFKESVAT